MAIDNKKAKERQRPVQTILISQPEPSSHRSPFYDLEKKWQIKIDWRPFIEVIPIENKEFRKNKVNLEDFTAIIMTSKNAVDFFFQKCEDLKINISTQTKYFCQTEAIANYLQKYIVYRKRKIFYGNKHFEDLIPAFEKFKEGEKFLLPTSNLGSKKVVDFLNKNNIEFKELMMFKTVASDLSDLSDITYDMLVFFNPLGIQSLYENFPDFKQNKTRIAVFGQHTKKETEKHNLIIDILAPTNENPSIVTAIDNYIAEANK
ncbi:MAG TPA: uroporphyrinogen-III synthase [Bacteroidetes bacterium]|nr:uroporphyrinogen-III synthase [Bacteroidota bacterium]